MSTQGSRRFAFPGARNPRICSISEFGKMFPAIFPGLSQSFPWERPNASHKQQKNQIHPRPRYFRKVSRYTSHFYRDTFAKVCPSSWQKVVYTTPNCITIRLPLILRYFFRSIRVRGRWNTRTHPTNSHSLLEFSEL